MPTEPSDHAALLGLVVDWGGVLTAPLPDAMAHWARTDGVDYGHFRAVMQAWVGPRAAGEPAGDVDNVYAALEQAFDTGPAGSSPVHLLERGEMSPADFEARLARALTEQGSPVEAAGLLDRMLGGLARLDDDMAALVSRARGSGIRTALLSNSWGDHYPERLWDGMFDAVVISGRVGMRKPDAVIYVHTADAIGLVPAQCVMVDDLPHNVEGARASGMVGVLHQGFAQTLTELEELFGRPLR